MRNSVKNRIIILIMAGIMCLSLCACGKKKEDKIHAPFFTAEPTSITSNLDYSYVEFGNYLQTKITDITEDIENAIYDDSSISNVSGQKIKRQEVSGKYEYYKIEPIIWKVIEVDGDEAVLIADKVIDCQPYNEGGGEIKWEDASIRAYLNDEFLNNAFDKNERKTIVESKVKNYSSNFGYPMTEEEDPDKVYGETTDYVYLSSLYEMDTYIFDNPYIEDEEDKYCSVMSENDFFSAESSDYALDLFNEKLPKSYSELNERAEKCMYMLRTYIEGTDYVSVVGMNDKVWSLAIDDKDTFTNKSSDILGVRPKIRVKIKALKVVKD